MDQPELQQAAVAFFDAFVVAVSSFDGEEIARRYRAPYLAVQADGFAKCFAAEEEIARYFQNVVDDYHARGCRSCAWSDLAVAPIGRQGALATVTWQLLHEDRSVMACWRESYNLLRVEGEWRIVASTDHVEA
jgi:hypothetical protein